ncbi:hypothetical protein BGZ80_002902 [Entomortierella chlamydospora]|uniref:Uncharacterized protein n=1 Tax=Entomortierella chlamydospora TaxID=101097 RepID=A0A9P6T305_9FUNG|nr:hypothetical protein BGZ80_002902 [Entomortierella chlamydospora]
MSQDSARAGVAGKMEAISVTATTTPSMEDTPLIVPPSVTTSVITQPNVPVTAGLLTESVQATAKATELLIPTEMDTPIELTTELLTISCASSLAVNTTTSVTTRANSTQLSFGTDVNPFNDSEQKDISATPTTSPDAKEDMNPTDNNDSNQGEENDQAYVNYHVNQTEIVNDEDSVAQTRIVLPKFKSESHSRKSISLPPLKTTPLISNATQTTSSISTTPATTSVTTPTPIATVKTTMTATAAIVSPNHGNEVVPTPPPSAQEAPKSRIKNEGNIPEGNNSQNGNGFWNGGVNADFNGYQNDPHVGYNSTHPLSTEASSPTDYFPSPYVLPPIPSFTEMGLKFDKSRTNSAESTEKQALDASANRHDHDDEGRSSTPRQCHQSQLGNFQFEDEIAPDYDPSIFDQIQSDENETYILWSSPLDSSVGVSPSSAADSVPATPQSNKQVVIPSTVATYENVHNPPSSPEPSSSSAVKRWSAGEAFKSKDKGRDSLDGERAHGQASEGVASEVSKSNGHTMETTAGQGLPLSPSFPKPLERLSGTISIKRPLSSVASPSSKSATTNAVVSSNPTEERVIMAATVEKLVEKLTSDIDYTFLTDFFLIYRLFISPLALLKLLVARFHWALTEDTPQRQVVRVRTFVTMRHWLLNYFEYDFMSSRALRRTHVKSLRELADHPIVRSSVRDKRIVKELRKLYHLKRKNQYREMAQMTLEQPSTRQTNEPSSRRSFQGRRATNSEWVECTNATSSKRSSMDTSEVRNTRHRLAGPTLTVDSRPSRSGNEGSPDDESTENESGLSSADGHSDDENMYVEEVHFVANGDRQHYQELSDDKTEDTDLDDDSEPTDALSNSGHLPSPAFSAESIKSKKVEPDYNSQGVIDNGADASYSTSSQSHPGFPHSPDASDHAAHSQRSKTIPRTLDARSFSRPLFCGDDTSSQYALSPPDSPRLLESYINPPPPSIVSTEKKKTWSHYMVATVEQLSKVKKALLPKPSSSVQDLRHNPTSASSASHLVRVASVGNGRPRGSSQDTDSMSNTHAAIGKHWNNEEQLYPGSGLVKPLHSPTTANASVATNSAASSLDGRRSREVTDQVIHHQSIVSSEWLSDEEEYQSESANKIVERTQTCGDSNKADRRSFPRQMGDEAVGYVMATQNERRLQQSSPCKSRRRSLPLDSLMAATGTARRNRQSLELNEQRVGQTAQEEEEGYMGPQTAGFISNSRALRRTTQKRDSRASWMTFSSSNSSVFGAVLSQGHLSPSQTIRERNDAGNVDRFMERLYQSQDPNEVSGASEAGHGGSEIPRRNGMCRKSTGAIHEKSARDGLARSSLNSDSIVSTVGGTSGKAVSRANLKQEQRGNESDNSKPGMSARRSHTLAQHPHRQTVPIMHLHYHHFLHHRQSESLLQGFPTQRRHSVEVQSLGAWRTSQQKERKNSCDITAPVPVSGTLLEGAAYAAALQETQRQLRLLISQENQNPKNSIQAPPVLPHLPGRPMGQARARPLASISGNSALQAYQPSNKISPISKLNQAVRGGGAVGPGGAYKIHSPIYPSSQGASYTQHHHHYHHSHSHSYEDSYDQQRSPMNPRFQNVISSTPRPRPTSIVLQHRSEEIAEQLCLIEREQLNQVHWYELVNAGWKKKSQEEPSSSSDIFTEDSIANTSTECGDAEASNIQHPADVNVMKESDLDHQPASTLSHRASPSPLNRSHTVKSHMQRFTHQSHTSDSPNVTQLVDRFNLMCRWVTSEILKTTDLEQRVKTCYNHSNFSSLTQIMVGLQVFEVSRLHRTWARVRSQEKKIMHELMEFTSMSRNWKHIRNAMKSIADEWGSASPSATTTVSSNQDGSTSTVSSAFPSNGKQQSLNLFSKMTGRDKDKEKHQQQTSQVNNSSSVHSKYISHNHSSSFGKSSGHSVTITSASVSGSVSGHHKTSSGQGFPSLVSSFTKEKTLLQTSSEKDKDANKTLGGCIPLLAVYLSDLLYNTELPSYIEPKASLSYDVSATNMVTTMPEPARLSAEISHHLPSPPQSAATTPYKAAGYHINSSCPTAAVASIQRPLLMVNMHKHRTTATIIKRILTFRTMANRYPFEKDTSVYNQLMAIEAPDQLELERLSDLCEERASSSGLASPVFAK